ncbi:unnamed protein product [Candidula unifasciata]|uniref:Uncharacterized protein n=1 Tax=Candidula unifasciata TaxID=100452 RepID=A0A8S4A1S2_9EUPU|nr:unnamed protein product [Candidula unifasciata]
MAGMYQFAHEPGLRPHLRNCPKTSIHVGSPASTRNRAQYHDLSRLESNFRYSPQGGVVETPPSPLDPYAMVNGYHHYHHERNIWNVYQGCYPQTACVYQQRHPAPVVFGGYRQPSHVQGQVQGYLPQSDQLSGTRIDDIRRTAKKFVENCCPLLGEKPYCLPPIERYRQHDKSNKKLIQGMESEKRVFGTFERFFVEQSIPVFMLCHYPLSGFLQVFKTEHLDKALMTLNGQHGKNTVMLLLSSTFGVTVLSVSIISSNSQFDHLRHRVLKSVTQMKEISATVSKWLTLLGVRSEVRQVIAFPNLKRSVLERICKDKQLQHNVGSFCTLHADELSAPFEEELSDPARKQQFHKWMLQNILSHDSTLSQEDLHLVVGALLSPKLSDCPRVTVWVPEPYYYDVGQMKLTVDGVTKSFDEFMDQYVTAYYPNVGERTYRVPPIHFNIQSLKKPNEYISAFKGDSVLKSINGGPVNKESNNFESHLSAHQSEIACIGNDTNSNFQGDTIQFKSIPHSSISFGKNSHSEGQGDLPRSAVVQSHYSFSNNLQKSGDYTEGERSLEGSVGQDSLSVRSSPDKFISSSGIYFKDSPNSSSSLLHAAVPASDTSHQTVALASSMRRELPDSCFFVARTPPSALLQAVQDVDILSKVMDKDIRKDEGENRVISALEMLGRRSNLGGQEEDPMFIICGYQYNNYLNKLREEMFSKEDISRPVRAFGQTMRAEHDCLIFHKTYGAIIVCIKAIGDNFEVWHATEDQKIACTKKILEKALKQLKREEAMIRHVTSDLPVKFKCHKLIALPNMSRESVKAALWTDLQLRKILRSLLNC